MQDMIVLNLATYNSGSCLVDCSEYIGHKIGNLNIGL